TFFIYGLLNITGGSSTVRGLVINRFGPGIGNYGISLRSNGNVVEGCFIGTDPTGTTARPDRVAGVGVLAQTNLVGGTTPAQRNVIADGVVLQAHANLIKGHYIGTNAAGGRELPNSRTCVASARTPGVT